jgi:hypothetical protein
MTNETNNDRALMAWALFATLAWLVSWNSAHDLQGEVKQLEREVERLESKLTETPKKPMSFYPYN